MHVAFREAYWNLGARNTLEGSRDVFLTEEEARDPRGEEVF